MKLKNRKTGEIGTLIVDGAYKFVTNLAVEDNKRNRLGEYDSLAKLNKEWEDYKEPKEYWRITDLGELKSVRLDHHHQNIKRCKEIGNYFETEEEAEKAAEKLRAWKRLKDNGLKISGYGRYIYDPKSTHCVKIMLDYATGDEVRKDLGLLFGGEK